MTAIPLNPNLLLQLLEGLLWAIVWAVAVLFAVECICLVALWLRDARRKCGSHSAAPKNAQAASG